MVIKPVSPRDPVQLEVSPIVMATECWQWCQGTWQKGYQTYQKAKESWTGTKKRVHDTIEWFWLLFLALVASDNTPVSSGGRPPKGDELCGVQVDTEDRFTDEFVDISEKDSHNAPKVESAQVSVEQQSYDEKTECPDVLVEEEELVVNVVRDEPPEVPRISKPSPIQPYTIVEEDEDEDDIEEKEKQWRVANGGLTRFAGLQNLAMRSQSLADEDAFNQESSATGQKDVPGSGDVKGDVLWQSLVAKYATDETAPAEDEKTREILKPSESSIDEDSANFRQLVEQHDSVGKITNLEEVVVVQEVESPQMSEKEFSAAVGKRLKEYLAKEDTNSTKGEVGEMSSGNDFEGTEEFTVDEVKDISDEVVSTSQHSDLPSDSCKMHFEIIDEVPELTMPKISDEEDPDASELRRDIAKMLEKKKPDLRSLRIETVDETEELLLDEDSRHEQGGSMQSKSKPKMTIELPDEDDKLPDDHSRSQVSSKIDDVGGIILEDVQSVNSSSMPSPLKIAEDKKLSKERENEFVANNDKHDSELIHDQSEKNITVDAPIEDLLELEEEEEEEEEVAVVADFCFKLRPKAKDTISFGLKEAVSTEISAVSASAPEALEHQSSSKSQSLSDKKTFEKSELQTTAIKPECTLIETDFPFIEDEKVDDESKKELSDVVEQIEDASQSSSVEVSRDSSSGKSTKLSQSSNQSSSKSQSKVSRSIVFNAAPFLGDDLGEAPKIMTYDSKESEPDVEHVKEVSEPTDDSVSKDSSVSANQKMELGEDQLDSSGFVEGTNKSDTGGRLSEEIMEGSNDTIKIIPADQLKGVFGEDFSPTNVTEHDIEEKMLENEEGTSVDEITEDMGTKTENMVTDKFNVDQYEIKPEVIELPPLKDSNEEYEQISSYEVEQFESNNVGRFNTDVAEVIDAGEPGKCAVDVGEVDIKQHEVVVSDVTESVENKESAEPNISDDKREPEILEMTENIDDKEPDFTPDVVENEASDQSSKIDEIAYDVTKTVDEEDVAVALKVHKKEVEEKEQSLEPEPINDAKHEQETTTSVEKALDDEIQGEVIDTTSEVLKEHAVNEDVVTEDQIDDITAEEQEMDYQTKEVDEVQPNVDGQDEAADFWSLLGNNDDLPVKPTVAQPCEISSIESDVAPVEMEEDMAEDQNDFDFDDEHLPSEVTEESASASKTLDEGSAKVDEQIQEAMELPEAEKSFAEDNEDFQRNLELAINEYMDDADPLLDNEFNTTKNLFSDIVVDETYNMILDKEASMEADESSGSIKKGILDTTVYDLDSNFDSKDIFDTNDIDMADSRLKLDTMNREDFDVGDNASIDEMLAAHIAHKDREVPEHLSDIQDLLTSRSDRSKLKKPSERDEYSFSEDEMPIGGEDETDLDKYRSLSPGLTAEEEAELAELAEIDKQKAEEEFKKFMNLPSGLTQQELDELAAFQEEKTSAQAIREAERRELEKFLDMPAGLTQQEQAELSDLLADDTRDTEISQATEDRLAAFLAAARAESGYTDDIEDEPLDDYLNLPAGLTEEEERMLREGTDGEVDLLKDEEDRERIRRRYLEELDEDEDRVLLDEYEFAEQYGSDYEYDDDYDYDEEMEGDFYFEDERGGEASGAVSADPMKSAGAAGDQKGVKRDSKVAASETRGDGEPVAPPRKAKKPSMEEEARKGEPSSKPKSFADKGAGEVNKSKVSKLGEENKKAEDVQNKKFFRLGALGTKRKRKTRNLIEGLNDVQANYKTVRKKETRSVFERDSGYNSFANDSTAGNSPTVKHRTMLSKTLNADSLNGSSLSLESPETEASLECQNKTNVCDQASSVDKLPLHSSCLNSKEENLLSSTNLMLNQTDSFLKSQVANEGQERIASYADKEGQNMNVLINTEKNVFTVNLDNQNSLRLAGDNCQPLISRGENDIVSPLPSNESQPITSTMKSNTMDCSAAGDCSRNGEILDGNNSLFCLPELLCVEESCLDSMQEEKNSVEQNEMKMKQLFVERISNNLDAIVVSETNLFDDLTGNENSRVVDSPNGLDLQNSARACSGNLLLHVTGDVLSEKAAQVSNSEECIVDGKNKFSTDLLDPGLYDPNVFPVAVNKVASCFSDSGDNIIDENIDNTKSDCEHSEDTKFKKIGGVSDVLDAKTDQLKDPVAGFPTETPTQKKEKKRKPRLSVNDLVQQFSSKQQEREKTVYLDVQKNDNVKSIRNDVHAKTSIAISNDTAPESTKSCAVNCSDDSFVNQTQDDTNSDNFGNIGDTQNTDFGGDEGKCANDITHVYDIEPSTVVNTTVLVKETHREAINDDTTKTDIGSDVVKSSEIITHVNDIEPCTIVNTTVLVKETHREAINDDTTKTDISSDGVKSSELIACVDDVGSCVDVNMETHSAVVDALEVASDDAQIMPERSTLLQSPVTVVSDKGAVQYSAMATLDEEASGECGSDAEEVVEEHKEYIENPDGSYTVKTIKTIVTMVEEEEEEEEAGEGGEKEEGEEDKFGVDGLGQLTEEELNEFMMLQAERKWLDKMAPGGAREEEEEETLAVVEEETTTKKKKKRPDGEKKGKKKKKRGDGKENKRDALAQRDILAKHVGPRVRSFDSAKMKSRFEKPKEPTQVSSDCRACGKQVFQMEKIVAEKASWHKNCFRCSECSKNLTLETYQSHEGVLYCKPHFKELFRPKAVVEDPVEARKERLLRRPKMIVLESNPEILPDDVVRATSKPDYGLEELSTLNMKQRFSMFEAAGQEDEEPKLEPVSVRRSQSMISRAARFLAENGEKEHGVDNSELGEYEDDEEEEEGLEEEEEEEETEEEIEEEDGVDEDGEPIIVKTTRKIKKKKTRPTSFNNASDMKEMFEKQSRRDEMTKMRKEELGRFRQMLCAGKNISLKEKFESGQFENEEKDKNHNKEEIKIDQKRAARSLKAKFEQGQPFIMDEDGENEHSRKNVGERQEVEEVFKEAETASHARNLFRQIDSKVNQDGSAALMRSQSFATVGSKENRRSMDVGNTPYTPPPTSGDVVKCHDPTDEDPHVDSQDLASKFMFFATFENRQKEDAEKKRKVFRMTPPREGADQGLVTEDVELGRDPNLIKCTDNYQDDVDCRNTKSILNMFRKMEAKNVMGVEDEDDDESEGEGEYDEEEYSDEEEYTDEEYSGEEEEEEEDDEEGAEERGKAPYKDELLQMSAKKAAQLRAKFEKWEAEVDRNNDINKVNGGRGEDDEEAMPSLDTARNLKAMFEEKAQEAAKPQIRERAKVNRFV